MTGPAAAPRPVGRRTPLLVGLATLLALWLGLTAPSVPPVSAPPPVVAAAPAIADVATDPSGVARALRPDPGDPAAVTALTRW